jgi:hypothetical protein
MFKAYQRYGHARQGALWSDECELDCEVVTSAAPSPVERAAPVAAAGVAAITSLVSIAWWLIRRRLLSP